LQSKISVLKFGGTSIENIDKIKSIASKLITRKISGENLVVVVSAMGKSTNKLVDLAKQISENPDKRELDMLLSTGEQVSISLLSIALKELGADSISLTGSQIKIITDNTHSKARINSIDKSIVMNYLNSGKIVVIAGFQGVTIDGEITTLGRGGSDTTAVSLAAVLNASCEIYTDVDGVYSIDPRIYPSAKKLSSIGYDEMLEMSSLGSGVIDVRAIELAHKYKVPIFIGLNTMDIPGTIVKEYDEKMEKKAVTGLSINDNILMVSISDIPFNAKIVSDIFSEIANKNIIVDMISQTAPYHENINISFTVEKDNKLELINVLDYLQVKIPNSNIYFDDSLIKLSVVGVGMISQSGVASKLFEIFSKNNIKFYQVTTSEISISYTIKETDMNKAVSAIVKIFNL